MGCLSLQVTPFSRWERELPKLSADSRYKAITTAKDRKALFDEFCRTSAATKPPAGTAAAAKEGEAAARKERESEAGENGVREAADDAAGDRKRASKQSDNRAKAEFRCVQNHDQILRVDSEAFSAVNACHF